MRFSSAFSTRQAHYGPVRSALHPDTDDDFLAVAVIAAIFGFSGVAGVATNIAWVLFGLFLILFIVSLVLGRRSAV